MAVEIKIDKEKCKGCELCISVCKKNVFRISEKFNKMGYNKMGYRFAEVVNEENCTGCANCAIICPDTCIEIMKGDENGKEETSTQGNS